MGINSAKVGKEEDKCRDKQHFKTTKKAEEEGVKNNNIIV